MRWIIISLVLISMFSTQILAKDNFLFSGTVGAAADLDKDGVIDANDKCANTYPGMPVDSNGCSSEQFCGNIKIKQYNYTAMTSCYYGDWKNNEFNQTRTYSYMSGGKNYTYSYKIYPSDCTYIASYNFDNYNSCMRMPGRTYSQCISASQSYYCINIGAN